MSHSSAPNHPKIKPILIQNFASGHRLNENNLRKSSTSSLKESRITYNLHFKRPFLKALRSQHQLSKLDYAIGPYIDTNPFQLINFSSNLKHLTNITTLNLNLIKSNQYDINSYLKILMKSLSSLKNLTNLHILFSLDMNDPKLLQDLLRYLLKISTLASLSLTFDSFPGLKIPHIQILSTVLSRLSHLQTLRLKFANSPKDMDHAFQSLASMLLDLRLLTKIELSLRGSPQLSPIEDSSMKALFTSFNSLKALSDLTLHNIIRDAYLVDLLAESFALLDPSRIRKLRLGFDEKLQERLIRGVSKVLKSFNALQTLRLEFSDAWESQDTDLADLAVLGSTIAGLTSLSYLSITFPLYSNPEGIFENIVVALESLKSLNYLKLHFVGQTGVRKNEKITQLFAKIELLKSLKSLAIDFEDSKFLTDSHLETLAKSIGKLRFLKNIRVKFTHADLITNQGVKTIINAIETLENLSGLKLGFAHNNQIDNEVMEKIQEALQSLPCLYAVRLDFLRCKKITSHHGLFQVLREMKNIGEIGLYLPRTKITYEEIEGLRKDKAVKKMLWI